jgi:hypothetical protein
MLLVIIESPYAATITSTVEENMRYAQACMLDSLKRGEAPYASHLLYTQILDDLKAEQRKQGIEAGLAWGFRGDLRAVYTDLGVSDGMKQGIESANSIKQAVVFRSIGRVSVW